MKVKKYYLMALLVVCALRAFAQQYPTTRVTLSLHNESLYNALFKVITAQPNMAFTYDVPPGASTNEVTLELRDASFEEAMDRILQTQSVVKDFVIINYGNYLEIRLRDQKVEGPRLIQREKNKGHYYHPGERLPDSTYSVSNFKKKTVKLSDFHSKLLILDLWNVNCGGCIDAMPHLEQLQKKFNGQIQIILVTKDSPEAVADLKKRSEIVRRCDLPFINGDNDLGSLFQYVWVPTQVWIDQSGRIVYKTLGKIADEEHIQSFIDGKRLPLKELKDTLISPDFERPATSALQAIHAGRFGISSYLGPHHSDKYFYENYGGGFTDTSSVKSLTFVRADFYQLYRTLYFGYGLTDDSAAKIRIVKRFDDPLKYDPDEATWQNYFDFELIMKGKQFTSAQFAELMRLQLDGFFGLKSRLEKRSVPCYILKSFRNDPGLTKHKGGYSLILTRDSLWAKNVPLNYLVGAINEKRLNELSPLLSGTALGGDTKINLIIPVNFDEDLPGVNRSLAAYGLRITKEERVMDCIILTNP